MIVSPWTPAIGRRTVSTATSEPTAPPPAQEEPEEGFSLGKTLAGGLLTFMGRRIPTTVPEITPEKASELKSKLQDGDVVLTADCAYPGWARMEFWTVRSNYTHAAYYSEGKILEAVGSGVQEVPIDDYFQGRTKVAIIRPPYKSPEDVKSATAYCRSHVGKKYDALFNLGDDKEFFCSELVHKALNQMPNPIASPTRMLGPKQAVAPDAFLYIQGASMVHDDKSNYWSNKLGHWPLAATALGGAVVGSQIGGVGGAIAGFATGLIGSILVGNKLQTGYFLPSFEDFQSKPEEKPAA